MSNQTLKTSDNELFKVEAVVAMKFCASNQYFDSLMTKDITKRTSTIVIPLLNVESRALARRAHHLLQETSRENEREGIWEKCE